MKEVAMRYDGCGHPVDESGISDHFFFSRAKKPSEKIDVMVRIIPTKDPLHPKVKIHVYKENIIGEIVG